uniref:Uncharacterized protein n=1 Tax=viral metagenome TaxID=1070528 RepID=A0A6C0JNA7_9ZZZZ
MINQCVNVIQDILEKTVLNPILQLGAMNLMELNGTLLLQFKKQKIFAEKILVNVKE